MKKKESLPSLKRRKNKNYIAGLLHDDTWELIGVSDEKTVITSDMLYSKLLQENVIGSGIQLYQKVFLFKVFPTNIPKRAGSYTLVINGDKILQVVLPGQEIKHIPTDPFDRIIYATGTILEF